MRVAALALVFSFLIRLRFPHSKSMAIVIRKRHGQNTIKKLRKLEKLDYRLRKAQIDLEFLVNCSNNSIVPKFLSFRVATKSLKSTRTYQQCQLSLLHEEIRQKKSNTRVLLKEFEFLHSILQAELSFIDFAHVCSLFLGHKRRQEGTIQQKKFNKLLKDKKPQHDSEKIIFNYSSYVLSETEKFLLRKGLNFSILPKKLNHADYLFNFELFYRDFVTFRFFLRKI